MEHTQAFLQLQRHVQLVPHSKERNNSCICPRDRYLRQNVNNETIV